MDKEIKKFQLHSSYWNNKKVLVTGHTGFKGGYLSLWLKKLGARVSGISLEPLKDQPSFFYLTGLQKIFDHHYIFDLQNNRLELEKIIEKIKPEIVFHLAAMPLVRESYLLPVETMNTNIMGTIHLLESLKKSASTHTIINITTDKCYENKEWVWGYRENDALGGKDPYSASKACSEIVTWSYYESFFKKTDVGVATARGGNVYGGGDFSADRLFPDCIRAYEAHGKIQLRYPQATRPWQYVLDVLHGYLILGEKLQENPLFYSTPFNFAPDDSAHLSVGEFVKKVFEALDYSKENIQLLHEQASKPHEASSLVLSNHKAKKYLQQFQLWNVEEGIKDSVAWYQKSKEINSNLEIDRNKLLDYTFQLLELEQKGIINGNHARRDSRINTSVL